MPFKKRIGSYIAQKLIGDQYKAYLPPHLPPNPAIDLPAVYAPLEKATNALADLNNIFKTSTNSSFFLYMYVRKEALLSSQIEGTQSSFSDLILFENNLQPSVSIDDVEEVSNYVKAMNYGLKRLREGFPLSLRLLREIHAILLKGTRGAHKYPGEFRKTQNWIGGTKPSNALFVPPAPEYLNDLLGNLEQFLYEDQSKLPLLIKAGIMHVQFETIHPFLDGNGRLGRLLIILFLCEEKILQEPILYLSFYLKSHRKVYYDLLQEVRLHGSWETWLEFFLEGVAVSAHQAVTTAQDINKLFNKDIEKIKALGRAQYSCMHVFEFMKKLPQVTVPLLIKELEFTAPTARSAVNLLEELGIVKEISNKKRDKIYLYKKYLDLLDKGMEPL